MRLETLRMKFSKVKMAEAKADRRIRRTARRLLRLNCGKLVLGNPTGFRSTRMDQAEDRFVKECLRANFLSDAEARIDRAIWRAERERVYGKGEVLPGHWCPWCGAEEVYVESTASPSGVCLSLLGWSLYVAKCNCESNNFHDRGHPGDCWCNK